MERAIEKSSELLNWGSKYIKKLSGTYLPQNYIAIASNFTSVSCDDDDDDES